MLVAKCDLVSRRRTFCFSLRLPGDLIPVPLVGGAVLGRCLFPPEPAGYSQKMTTQHQPTSNTVWWSSEPKMLMMINYLYIQ